MQPIYMIIDLLTKQETQKRLPVPEADIMTIKNDIDLMSVVHRMHFLEDVFELTPIAPVSLINHSHINGLHLFWDTWYI